MNEKAGKRDTVGKISTDLSIKTPESRDPIEIQREMTEAYLDNVFECLEIHKSIFDGNFFISVLTKKEPLMPNVFRNYFLATQACPTPTYDQTVFAYDKSDDNIVYVWTIPSKDTCHYLINNAKYIVNDNGEKELLDFVLQFQSGRLDKLTMIYNGGKI